MVYFKMIYIKKKKDPYRSVLSVTEQLHFNLSKCKKTISLLLLVYCEDTKYIT